MLARFESEATCVGRMRSADRKCCSARAVAVRFSCSSSAKLDSTSTLRGSSASVAMYISSTCAIGRTQTLPVSPDAVQMVSTLAMSFPLWQCLIDNLNFSLRASKSR
eukprot:2481266-Rhodomonas_salina.1